ncbi:hypothetical protein C8R43DRAFT_1004804 [Mycena crocata]|nr:hypothetical protein C8R43DRAFT_1004804 [Mycena crocata]
MDSLELDPKTIAELNEELQPVFRLITIESAGWPGGCPPGINNHVEFLNLWIQKVCSQSTIECLRLADAGDPQMIAAAGVELPSPNSTLAERYWNKILQSPRTPPHLIGTAHAQLIIFTGIVTEEGGPGPSTRLTDLKAAGAHAELAAKAGLGRAPNVLKLGKILQNQRTREHKELLAQWTHFWAAVDGWAADRQATLDKETARKVARPSRFKCAAPGCPIEASTGKLLRACGGKCEDAYKPRYCTKECQKTDWTNHKPMCKPGLEAALKLESATRTASSRDPALNIQRHDVVLGGPGVVSMVPPQTHVKSGGQYSAQIGGVKLHSSSLSAEQVKRLAGVMSSKSEK